MPPKERYPAYATPTLGQLVSCY